MRRIFLLIFLLLIFLTNSAAVYNLQHDDGTLAQAWFGSFYRGVRFYVSDSCTLNVVNWGRYTKRQETDTVFVYTDSANAPNRLLYSKALSLNTNSSQQIIRDTIATPVVVSQKFWVVLYSRTQDSPSNQLSYFISDGAGTGNSFWQDTSGIWVENTLGDYIIHLTVTGPLGMITLKEDDEAQAQDDREYIDFVKFCNKSIFSNNETADFQFSLKSRANVSSKIVDFTGRTIKDLSQNMILEEGIHNLNWRIKEIPKGTYFFLLQVNGKIYTQKLIIIK